MFILKTPAASALPHTRARHCNLQVDRNIGSLFSLRVHLVLVIIVAVLVTSSRAESQLSRQSLDTARRHRADAEQLNQQADQISRSDRSQQSARVRDAAERLSAAYRSVAAAKLKLADAYEKGIPAGIDGGQKELKQVDAAQARVWELYVAALNVESYNSTDQTKVWLESTHEAARPQLEVYLNSRNVAANAAAALANALEAEADAQTLADVRDEWLTAQRNVNLHHNAWSQANHVGYSAAKAAEEKDAARLTTFNTLKQLDAEILKLSLEDSEVKTKKLKSERQRQKAEAALADLLGPKTQ